MEFDTQVFEKAGLNKSDISRLFGVSRTTVHNWHSGKKVHPLIQTRVKTITSAVNAAVNDSKFPVSTREAEGRQRDIAAVIKAYL